MDIVFVHGNYPAQFRHLACALGSQGHRVIFITAREDAETQPMPGVEIHKFSLHRQANSGTHHYLTATEEAVLKGQAVIRALSKLVEEGLSPRLVITHAGMGLGLFIKDLLPKTIHIGLFEWFFQPTTAKWLLAQFTMDEQLKTRMRNLPILDELCQCDVGIVPTNWQKEQFPEEYKFKLRVIFDGIDKSFFKSNPDIDDIDITLEGEDLPSPLIIKPSTPVMSYATRGMETLRGFPEFLQAAAKVIEKIPDLQVVIAGRDRRAYSYDAPSHDGSWKRLILENIGKFEGRKNIHFTGLMPYIQYRKLLQRSNLHCYFSRPYVTSWSLFEAASCQARLCINRSRATEDIVLDDSKVTWVDLDNAEEIENKMYEALNQGALYPRSELNPKYYLSNCLEQWSDLVNELLINNKVK